MPERMPKWRQPPDPLEAASKDPNAGTPWTPWRFAVEAARAYITPEDIQRSIDAGMDEEDLAETVLEALSRKACEDWSLCAFVAHQFERSEGGGSDA